MIDIESIRLEIVTGLPIRVHWALGGASLDFDFSRSQTSLHPLAPNDLNGGVIENEWTGLFIFGEQAFANGGGACSFLAIHQNTGGIYGLDVEREKSPVFLLNSNADRFIQTVQQIDRLLRKPPLDPAALAEALRQIDPVSFERSDWKDFSLC